MIWPKMLTVNNCFIIVRILRNISGLILDEKERVSVDQRNFLI